jgi:hypothetical protein
MRTEGPSEMSEQVRQWLLDARYPAVRYLALRDLLSDRTSDAELEKARRAIMTSGVVPAILEHQKPEGYWGDASRFYHAKYEGTVWQLLILAEHCADGGDPRVRRACDFVFENAQDMESGGFAVHRSVRSGGGRHTEVLPCLTGNMVFGLIRLGRLDDPRTQAGIDWITTYQRFDDAESSPPDEWPYDRATACFGRHTCHMAVVKSLKALAEIPFNRRSGAVQRTIDAAVSYLLAHHVYKRSHDLSKVSKPGWKRFGFPLMYQTDVLEILDTLTGLGIDDDRMQEALDLMVSKRAEDGRWRLDNTFNGKMLVDIESKGEPSRWITLRALRTLRRLQGNEAE